MKHKLRGLGFKKMFVKKNSAYPPVRGSIEVASIVGKMKNRLRWLGRGSKISKGDVC